MVPTILDPIDLFCYNSGAVAQTKEPRSHQRTGHVLRRFNLIREINKRGNTNKCKVPGEDNVVDPLTKPLAQAKHERHVRAMGIRVINDCA